MQTQSRAVLVRLSIGLPGFSRQDKPLTERVKSNEGMGKESGKWQKQLYPASATEPLTQYQGKVRTWFSATTLIWPDEGWALLPTAKLFEFTEKMREFRNEFECVKGAFLFSYYDYVEWAKIQHNGSFDPANYPGRELIGEKFRFRTETRPIPDSGDYVDEVSQLLGNSAQEVDEAIKAATDEAHKDLWRRVLEPLKHMATTLADGKAIFRDSLVGNIREIIHEIPLLNVCDDPVLSGTAGQIGDLLNGISAQTLRDDKFTRAEVAGKAAEIANRMSSYFA